MLRRIPLKLPVAILSWPPGSLSRLAMARQPPPNSSSVPVAALQNSRAWKSDMGSCSGGEGNAGAANFSAGGAKSGHVAYLNITR